MRALTLLLPISFFAVFALAGCTNNVVDTQPDARAAATSSDALTGSCASACGGQSADGCWCDALCESYGDCCDDVDAACSEPETNACFDDSQCDDGEFCLAADTAGCCPPNALCSFDVAPCQGQCQAPVICPAFVPSCEDGEIAADVNGNGCIDGCIEDEDASDDDDEDQPEIECFDNSACPVDQICIAIDSQGCCPPNALCSFDVAPCAGVCHGAVVCPEIWPVCGDNEEPADTNGDGCVNGCSPTETVLCEADGDCADGFCEHFAACMGMNCPPPPPSQCVFPNCDDGTIPACKLAAMPDCLDSEVLAIKDSCYSCVDARTCEVSDEPPLQDGFCSTDSDCDANEHCQSIQCITTPCPPGICEANECLPILCNVGTAPSDTTGDGCYDDCVVTAPSCEGSCGGEADGCWCDESCAYYGDCCDDVEDVCQ